MLLQPFLRPAWLFAFLLVIVAACKKQNSPIGLDIQPEEDLLGATYCDTSTIYCYSIKEDSLRTDETGTSTSYNLLGSYFDPAFGRTDASIFTNFTMPNNIIGSGFGANAKLDSVVLALSYSGSYYADKTDALKFNVYRLNEGLSFDSNYFSNRILNYNPADITYTGQGLVKIPDLTTNVTVLDNYFKPQLRLRLKDEIGQYFIDDTSRIASTTALQQAFKGVYITTRNTSINGPEGNILYMNMASSASKLIIYYHNGNNLSSKAMDLSIGTFAARYNHFKHDYTTAHDSLKNQLQMGADTTWGLNNIFLQGMAGVKAKINIPYLGNLSDSGAVAINKAELVLKVNAAPAFTNQTNYNLPPRLILDGINEKGETVLLADIADPYSYGGNYDPLKGEYRFNIPFTVQQMVSKKYKNFRFYLRVYFQQANPARVVLGGSKHPNYPMKLKLWYTKLY